MSAAALDAFQTECCLHMIFLNDPRNWSVKLGILTFNLIWRELDLEAKQSTTLINQATNFITDIRISRYSQYLHLLMSLSWH